MPLAWWHFSHPEKIPQRPAIHLSHVPTITPCKGKKKTKLFARGKSVPNHQKPEAKNLLYTFLLSEIILSSGIYNYTGTTRLWRRRKYHNYLFTNLSWNLTESTWAETLLPLPLSLSNLTPAFKWLSPRIHVWECCLHAACHRMTGQVQKTFSGRCHVSSRDKVCRGSLLFWCSGNTVSFIISWKNNAVYGARPALLRNLQQEGKGGSCHGWGGGSGGWRRRISTRLTGRKIMERDQGIKFAN